MYVGTYRVGGPLAVALALTLAKLMTQPAVAAVHDPGKAVCAAAPSTAARIASIGVDRPQMAVDQGLYGTTVVRVDLDAAGALQRATVAKSSGVPMLDEAALSGARTARYVAETSGCNGIPGSYVATIDFTS